MPLPAAELVPPPGAARLANRGVVHIGWGVHKLGLDLCDIRIHGLLGSRAYIPAPFRLVRDGVDTLADQPVLIVLSFGVAAGHEDDLVHDMHRDIGNHSHFPVRCVWVCVLLVGSPFITISIFFH